MKRNLSAREIAGEMASVMVEHLETLPVEERRKKIKAGQKVTREKGKDSGFVLDVFNRGSSSFCRE